MSTRDAALDYVAAGFALVPIPLGLKNPTDPGWQLEQNAIRTIEQAARLNGGNIGIAHRWCGTCAVDVDDYLAATAWLAKRRIALEVLLAATDAVQISSGRPNRTKLLYRLPDGVPWLPLIPALGKGFELRCAAKDGASTVTDVLPPSIHELTHKPYVWAGAGDWRDPPELPAQLLALWRELAMSHGNGARSTSGRSDGGPVPEGGRNAFLTSLAGSMRQRGMGEVAIYAALMAENKERCVPPLPQPDVACIAKSVSRYAPGASREEPPIGEEPAPRGNGKGAAGDEAKADHGGTGKEKAAEATRTEPGLTDLGNAHRFARDHRANVRYCWPWGRWLVWNGRYWCRDETGEIHRLAEVTVRGMYEEAARSPQEERRKTLGGWAVKCESHERRTKMLASTQAIEGIPIQPEDMDRDPWLLNVRNGTIDLRTGTLRPHARQDYITRAMDVDYDPEAACAAWERFVYEVFGGNAETIAFVQRAIGYSLTGEISEHVLLVLHGLGSNGKSTLLGALHFLLGPYAQHAPTDLLLARRGEHHPTELAALHGARLVTAAETGEGRRLAESLVKQLTGGDPVTARRMREDFWQYRPEFKLWLATNHKPQIKGTDHAIWRRLRLIPFDVTFHKPETGKTPLEDQELPGRLQEEAAGILAWAVRGCLGWQRQGLNTPQAVRDATEGYRAEMDVLAAFLAERCVEADSAEVRAADLYRAYTEWCEAAGERAESHRSLGQRLTERGCERYLSNGVWYLGIGLRAAEAA